MFTHTLKKLRRLFLRDFIVNNFIIPAVAKFKFFWETIKSIFSTVAEFFGEKFGKAFEFIKQKISPIVQFFQGIWNSVVALFTTIGTAVGDAISGAVKSSVNAILSGAGKIINGFIASLNFAIGILNNLAGVSISPITPLDIPQLAKGGIVNEPTLSVIGEAGKEAVMPLENNTGWINNLANMLTSKMNGNITPTNSNQYNNTTNQGNTNQEYLTSNNSTQTIQGDTDNSVVFNQGAIQVTVQNASEEEAVRLAKTVMAYIKRQQEIDDMVNYG